MSAAESISRSISRRLVASARARVVEIIHSRSADVCVTLDQESLPRLQVLLWWLRLTRRVRLESVVSGVASGRYVVSWRGASYEVDWWDDGLVEVRLSGERALADLEGGLEWFALKISDHVRPVR